jgi:hypothetical protein
MSMSDSLPGISAASPFRLVSRYSLPGDLAGSPRFRRIPFDAVPLSETPVRAQWFLPIANHCMLPSSYSILSASPMTSISGLKTFTCVAAQHLLSTGSISFVTSTDAASVAGCRLSFTCVGLKPTGMRQLCLAHKIPDPILLSKPARNADLSLVTLYYTLLPRI